MPNIVIPDKICPHCGGNKWYHNEKKNFYSCYYKQTEKQKQYRNSPKGKAKLKAYSDRYQKENREKISTYYKEIYEKNKEKYKINSRKYRQTEKGKAALKRAKNKQSENLTDYYIVNNYYVNAYIADGVKINRKDVTKEHIELQRNKIKLQRQLNLTSYGNS